MYQASYGFTIFICKANHIEFYVISLVVQLITLKLVILNLRTLS